jgi:Na+(H+)/acetate symporter ActP
LFVSTLEIVQGLDLGVLVFGFIIADVIFLLLIANVLRNF